MTLTFLLDYQQISRTDKSVVVAGSVNYLRAKFSPKSDDWKLPVTALFNDMAVLLDENWECAVPWEVVQQAGTFTVSAFCGSLQTANTVTVPVVASGYKNGETPPEPTPDVYNQVLGLMQEAKDAAETAQEAAGIAQDAAEHAPTIIDGVWHEWDAEAGAYKSTGMQAQGPEGERGPKGDKGDTGDKGDKGDTGAQGPIGPTGETGPVGPQGEKGDTGSQGPQGVPGTAATITIGSVTESAPGGDASVTNSGTATAAVLDFVIPRGETGPTGATGATGPAGLGVPQPTAEDAGKIPVVNADGSGYELGNPAPEVDATLSIPGSPADAAAVGEAIEAVTPDDDAIGAKPWSSQQIIDALCPPLKVAGNPVQCYPVANYPLGVSVSWEPRQEGEGDPSPENIRPITGLDEVQVVRCGANLLDFSKITFSQGDIDGGLVAIDYAHRQITIAANTNNVGYVQSLRDIVGEVPPGTYVLDAETSSVNARRTIYMVDTGRAVTFGTPTPFSEADLNSMFSWYNDPDNPEPNTISNIRFCMAPTSYAPYTGTTATLTLPETIYGGELDAVTGVGEQTVDVISLSVADMSGSDEYPGWTNQNWIGNYVQDTNQDVYFQDVADYIASNADGSKKLRFNGNTVYFVSSEFGYTRSEMQSLYPDLIFQFAFKRLLPNPIQATGGQSIPALPGTNTIYTDADSLTVTGRADPVQTINALNDRIAALEDAATGG